MTRPWYVVAAIAAVLSLLLLQPLLEAHKPLLDRFIAIEVLVLALASVLFHAGVLGALTNAPVNVTARAVAQVHGVVLGPILLAYWAGGFLWPLYAAIQPEAVADLSVRPVIAVVIWWGVGARLALRLGAIDALSDRARAVVAIVALVALPATTLALLAAFPVMAIALQL